MSIRQRYLTHRDFRILLGDLHLIDGAGSGDLEFLDRQNILRPVAYVTAPPTFAFELRNLEPPEAATQEARTSWVALESALFRYKSGRIDDLDLHPLDLAKAPPWSQFVEFTSEGPPFIDWLDRRTNLRPDADLPLFTADGHETFYHGWQALLYADAVEMGIHILFDIRRPDLKEILSTGGFRELPKDLATVHRSHRAPRGLENGCRWAPYFDANARFSQFVDRQNWHINIECEGKSKTAIKKAVSARNKKLRALAKSILQSDPIDRKGQLRYLRYLCERWEEWTNRGRTKIADGYKSAIFSAVEVLIWVGRKNFADISAELGRVTGHFKDTLDVIIPDWEADMREKVGPSFMSLIAMAPACSPAMTLDEADIEDFLDWLKGGQFFKIHISLSEILNHQFKNSPEDRSVVAKEGEAIAGAVEDATDRLIDQAGVVLVGKEKDGLLRKLQRLWGGNADVTAVLSTHFSLVSTKSFTRNEQKAKIDALVSTSDDFELGRLMLKCALFRNASTHNSMSSWSDAEVREASQIALLVMMLSRKAFRVAPPVP